MTEAEVLLPSRGSLHTLCEAGNLPVFGERQLAFAAALSGALMRMPTVRRFPELVALGFWLRPAHLKALLEEPRSRAGSGWMQPRGLCFHIAPGNVDTIFVYSWMVSLLCGNRSVIRLSSRHGEQSQCLLEILSSLLEDLAWDDIAQRVLVLRYGHDEVISARLSAACDVRVIWGGDASVRALRSLPLAPTATELCFPDKFSLAMLDVATVAAMDELELARLTKRFIADAYSFGQMACSSPRLVLWRGPAKAARVLSARFWAAASNQLAAFEHELDAADAMNKRVAMDLVALAHESVQVLPSPASQLQRLWLDRPAVLAEEHCGGGLFHEASFEDFAHLQPLWTRRIQTVTTFGIPQETWQGWMAERPVGGIDRIVPVGAALEFGPIWDGQDLWSAFTRRIAWLPG
jgi:hypothetical protein